MTNYRTAYLEAYKENIIFIPFLSTFFKTIPSYIRNSKTVKIDIKRGEKRIAPVISAVTGRGGKIQKKQYTGKEFEPPVVSLGSVFDSSDYENKIFGIDEYRSAEVEYIIQMQDEIMEIMQEIEARFNRNIEWQAAQIFDNGTVTLYDDKGNPAFEIDFKSKTSHFPQVTVSWSDPSSDPDLDISNLAKEIQKNGHSRIKNLVFGEDALRYYLRNTKIEDKFDIRRMESGVFDPMEQNDDVTYLGRLRVGTQYFDCWEYTGDFIHPETETLTPFVDPDKVLFLPSVGGANVDYRKVYCRVFTITGSDPRFSNFVPTGQINLDNRAYTLRVWADEGADNLTVELKTRPLCIPVSIDTFGALNTVAPSP